MHRILLGALVFGLLGPGAGKLSGQAIGTELPEAGLYLDSPYGKVNLRVVERNLRLYFLDEAGAVAQPPGLTAVARLDGIRNNEEEYVRLTLAPSGRYLTSLRYIPLPYDYFVNLVLLEEPREVREYRRFEGVVERTVRPKTVLDRARLRQL